MKQVYDADLLNTYDNGKLLIREQFKLFESKLHDLYELIQNKVTQRLQ